jgi:hypothetical protein
MLIHLTKRSRKSKASSCDQNQQKMLFHQNISIGLKNAAGLQSKSKETFNFIFSQQNQPKCISRMQVYNRNIYKELRNHKLLKCMDCSLRHNVFLLDPKEEGLGLFSTVEFQQTNYTGKLQIFCHSSNWFLTASLKI